MAYMGGGGYSGLGNESWLVVESCSRFGNKACESPLPNKHFIYKPTWSLWHA
jgi:hypothetical protein